MFKQWAAGAPVIGAAPVSSGKPKRLFRLTGIRRVERSNFFGTRDFKSRLPGAPAILSPVLSLKENEKESHFRGNRQRKQGGQWQQKTH
jgi:hypothetical protein